MQRSMLLGMMAVLAAVGSANAQTISYDGSYAPGSLTPPVGQSTWSVWSGAGSVAIAPNTPSAGLARANDNVTNGRLSFFHTLSAMPLADLGWTMETRLRINSISSNSTTENNVLYGVIAGVRDEGIVGGKNGSLAWHPQTGHLYLGQDGLTAGQLISNYNFEDGEFHTYRVEKFQDNGNFFVQVFVDDVAQFANPVAYSSLLNQSNLTNGLGYFTSTGGTSNVDIDYLTLQVHNVPEPASIGLWGTLGIIAMLAAYKWRRRAQ